MTVNHSLSDGLVRIELHGELGHHEAITAMQRINEIIEVHLPRRVQLDLAGLSFMDSSGIAVVMRTLRGCCDIGAALSLQGTPQQARRVLSAAGVDKVVDIK